MAKAREYSVTMEQGCCLLQMVMGFTMPPKLGEKAYSAIERVTVERDVVELFDAIKAVSPLMRRRGPEHGDMFGPEENWEIAKNKDGNPVTGDVKDVTTEVKISLTEKAVSGAMWLLFFAMHPDSPLPRATAKIRSDLLFPLAWRLHRKTSLEAELGLKSAKSKEWMEDEPSAEEDTTVLRKEVPAT